MGSKPANYYFTVFTPTYNRAHTLHRVYNSLCSQTYRHFEWLIIDDGSTDNTKELVEQWINVADFPIRYLYQENQGKHIAWNRAADLAHGEYFLCADSDDAFVPHALERFSEALSSIGNQENERFYGVVALYMDTSGAVIGDEFPAGISVTDFVELHLFKYRVQGDKWNCGKTAIHRIIRFDETIRGCLLPEGTVWFRIGRKYKIKLLNEPLGIFFPESDSLCHSFTYQKNAPGMRVWSSFILNEFIDYLPSALGLFLQQAKVYSRSCFHLGIPVWRQLKALRTMRTRLLWAITAPYGYALYLYDKSRKSRRA